LSAFWEFGETEVKRCDIRLEPEKRVKKYVNFRCQDAKHSLYGRDYVSTCEQIGLGNWCLDFLSSRLIPNPPESKENDHKVNGGLI